MGAALMVSEHNIHALAGGVQTLDSGEERFVAVGAAVRTNDKLRFPGLLPLRSCNVQVPGVGYLTANNETKNDLLTTTALSHGIGNYCLSNMEPNLFHLDDLKAHAPNAGWNAMCVKWNRLNTGKSVRFTLYVLLWSAGARHNYSELGKILGRAFESVGYA